MKRSIILLADYMNDLRRFKRHSAFGKTAGTVPALLEARLMIAAHGLEKALSFRGFEPRRAKAKLANTLKLMGQHRRLGLPEDATAMRMAQDAVANYRRVHDEAGIDISDLLPETDGLDDPATAEIARSVRQVGPDALTAEERAALLKGLNTRASIREYGEDPIDPETIRQVVRDSLATPSVCNRQGFRVHATLDPKVIRTALGHQNGNSGFGDRVPGLFIVTCSMTIFSTSSERNQAFVDGGLFSMSLMLSLHAHGFGACPLNWSASYRQDNALRAAVSIPDDEVVIMMISFGPLAEDTKAAGSRRYALDHVLKDLEART